MIMLPTAKLWKFRETSAEPLGQGDGDNDSDNDNDNDDNDDSEEFILNLVSLKYKILKQ